MDTTEEFQRSADNYRNDLFSSKASGLRAEWIDYIYDNILKKNKPLSLSNICGQIRFKYADCCDDNIPCIYKGKIHGKQGEWVHQVRLSLNCLKKHGKSINDIRGYWKKL
jgi:hypothetical protein